MSSKREVVAYFRRQCQPKTLPEITKDLHSVINPNEVEDLLKVLIEDGQVVCKYICPDCSLYWKTSLIEETLNEKSEHSSIKHQFKTPVLKASIRQPSSKSCQPFKSPAVVQRSNTSVTPIRPSSRTNSSPNPEAQCHETPAKLAREILTLKSELKQVEEEVAELTKDYHVQELQSHIDTLHEYNEIKDAGQTLLGKLAEVEGTTTACLYNRYGLELTS